MKDTYNLSEFRSFRRARQIVGGATLLLALTLAWSPLLWGQCGPPYDQGPITNVSVSVSPGSVFSGPNAVVTATISVNTIVNNPSGWLPLGFAECVGDACGPWFDVASGPFWDNYVMIACGQSSATIQFVPIYVTQPTMFTLKAWTWGATGSADFEALPAGQPANPANLGHTKCVTECGSPINLTDGNVWIQQRDYSVPGLGGGLELSRLWNSRWMYAIPPTLAGMFGVGWRSTYEEQLYVVDAQTLQYWRGDGSAWTFTYNSTLNSYSLTSPPDERAQLVSNPTGGFTLTLADGTEKVFNSQNLLSAVIDRNKNQTTLAYDSSNRLTSITSPGGSTLNFTYGDSNNPMQATTVQDSVGVVATYTYDSSSRLTLVSYPDGSALNISNDPNSSMILSVTDSQGKLIESHTYDAQGRGLTSSRAYGVDSVSLSY